MCSSDLLHKARAMAQRAACINNLKQIGLSMVVYEGDYGRYPVGFQDIGNNFRNVAWHLLLYGVRDGADSNWNAKTPIGNYKVLRCPGDTRNWTANQSIQWDRRCTYVANSCSLANIKTNGDTDPAPGQGSYNGLCGSLRNAYKSPSKILTILESPQDQQRADTAKSMAVRTWLPDPWGPIDPNICHKTSANYLMWDGHVENLDHRRWGSTRFTERYFYNSEQYKW